MNILPTPQKDVYKEAHRQCYHPEVEANDNLLEVVFSNGELVKETSLQDVREVVDSQLKKILSEEA